MAKLVLGCFPWQIKIYSQFGSDDNSDNNGCCGLSIVPFNLFYVLQIYIIKSVKLPVA